MILRTISLIAAITISSIWAPSANAALIYDLANYPADQNGHSLSGTITTTDTAPDDGQLLATEILSWEIDVIGPHGFSGAMSDANSNTLAAGVAITPTEIVLPYPQIIGVYDFQLYIKDHAARLAYVRAHEPFGVGFFSFYTAERPAAPDAWHVVEPLMNNSPPNHGTAPWVVGTRVPEPSSLMLLCSLAGVALFRRSLKVLAKSGRPSRLA